MAEKFKDWLYNKFYSKSWYDAFTHISKFFLYFPDIILKIFPKIPQSFPKSVQIFL